MNDNEELFEGIKRILRHDWPLVPEPEEDKKDDSIQIQKQSDSVNTGDFINTGIYTDSSTA